MNKNLALFLKANLAVVWLAIVLAVIMPELVPFSSMLIKVGLFFVVAHIIEIAVFRHKLESAGDYMQTFFFGIVHVKTIGRKNI